MISGTIYFSKPLGYWRIKIYLHNEEIDTELVRFTPSYPCNDVGIQEENYKVLKTLVSDICLALGVFTNQVKIGEPYATLG